MGTIHFEQVTMRFPIPRRIREMVFRPLAKKRYVTALHDFNLDVNVNDRVALLGPNGAGKTTFLKLTGGLLLPSTGTIKVHGHDTVRANHHARKAVGFVINEERSFYWRLTGVQNLEFFGALDNIPPAELKKKIKTLTELVGLKDAANREVAGYSSGMKQRLAIARGLISDPEILILDEPTRTLDPEASEEILHIILDRIHKDSGKTLLIASHRLEKVQAIANKVCVLKKGRIVDYTTVSAILDHYPDLDTYYRACMKKEAPQTQEA